MECSSHWHTPKNAELWTIAFTSKNLTSAKINYNNTEKEPLGILHGLGEFHHYCSTYEVEIITYHKPLVAVFKKDITQTSNNNTMNIMIQHENAIQCYTLNAIESCMDIPDCMTVEEIRITVLDDVHIGMLSELILHGWPSTKS